MQTLVVNSGSSSIKFSMFDSGPRESLSEPSCLFDGQVSNIGKPDATLELRGAEGTNLSNRNSGVTASTPEDAMELILDAIREPQMAAVEAVGYRVVHPGPKLHGHQRITAQVLSDLEEAVAFAPMHDPTAIAVIRSGMKRFPHVAHYACFDTAFHRTMPAEATTYPVPQIYRDKGARRYGFHGLSCESIVRQIRAEAALDGSAAAGSRSLDSGLDAGLGSRRSGSLGAGRSRGLGAAAGGRIYTLDYEGCGPCARQPEKAPILVATPLVVRLHPPQTGGSVASRPDRLRCPRTIWRGTPI